MFSMEPEELVQKIKIGMTRAEVKAVLGEPTDMSVGTRKYKRPMIWKYGPVELHFGYSEDAGLWLVGLYEDPNNHITLMRQCTNPSPTFSLSQASIPLKIAEKR